MRESYCLTDALYASWMRAGRPRRVLTAVSGGADSMALLCGLNDIRARAGFELTAVHVDHGLRGDSGEDAAFTASFCESIGVKCVVQRAVCRSASENDAREARYVAFAAVYASENADVLALAHHRRDQTETVLMHLFRGSGVSGLTGMREVSAHPVQNGGEMTLWRPFLDAPPEALRDALRDRRVSWREDGTNAQDGYARNYLRRQVLPLIEARYPGAEEAVARAAFLLWQEDDCLREMTDAFLRKNACLLPPCRFVLRAEWTALHPALRARVLRAACPVPLSFAQTQRLFVIAAGENVNLPQGWHAEATEKHLFFLPPEAEKTAPGILRTTALVSGFGDGVRSQAMPLRRPMDGLTLRYRQPGDRICPLGAKGEKSLQDYLVDRRVDRPLRDHIPLLCKGNRVYWVIGVGPGEEMRVRPGEEAVLLTYDGLLPGEIPAWPENT